MSQLPACSEITLSFHWGRREDTSGTCETVMEGLKPQNITIENFNVVMELENTEAIEMAVERGVGIAFVSEMVAARGRALGRIKRVDVQGLDWICAVKSSWRGMSAFLSRAPKPCSGILPNPNT